MIKSYCFDGFTIYKTGNYFRVTGNKKAAAAAFKAINRKPPDRYGMFTGRTKAGACACVELILKRGYTL